MKQAMFETEMKNNEERQSSKYMGGLFIFIGGIFLLSNSGVSIMGHSLWHLMALVPIFWIGMAAYKRYKEDGRITGRVLSILVFGLIPFAYVGASILGLNMAAIWPVGIIVAGVSFILYGSRG